MSKIVVTGYGIIAPNTQNRKEFLHNLRDGNCCLQSVIGLGPNSESIVVGLIDKGLEEFENNKYIKRLPRVTKLGIKAAKEALEQAKITNLNEKKVGLFFGTSLGAGGEKSFQNAIIEGNRNNFNKIPVTFSHIANYHCITSAIGHYLGVKGITKTITTGCTSSLEAIQDAMVYLKSGIIDIAIVGGSDSPICQATIYAFAKTKVIPLGQSLENGAVPFHEESDGFAMSEAGGVLILEKEDAAIKRGIEIKGEIASIVSNNDGVYTYSVDETGDQMVNLLHEIARDKNPSYINSQALGIQTHDQIEKRCSQEIFNHKTPYTSIKSMYGNPFGAIGVLQVISSLLSIEHGFIPPTIRTTKRGFENMNIVTSTVYQDINEVLITNHGHGGNNACASIKKYEGDMNVLR
ncbi:beta-ketoacyl synthase [Bacillus sp. FJAT-29790]|uniref:beta-ketoacyl-[acyl-carrier-protein] synthase family protein n=1 Tax=Bacillus sp. FJAT-29790 TaxID=1895002 RepID=UPI001C243B84|nr:beta-ketoacyl synthase N-terminal-like domain-containing protein [Bacillus sp. FJAT-29790]MBU8878667.1 beta-ketoacyl synthase [Bacillus sp. FJAT-29790]